MDILNEMLMNKGLIIVFAVYVIEELLLLYVPKWKRYLPLIAAMLGCLFASLEPALLSESNRVVAGAMGLVLGFSAMGVKHTVLNIRKNK